MMHHEFVERFLLEFQAPCLTGYAACGGLCCAGEHGDLFDEIPSTHKTEFAIRIAGDLKHSYIENTHIIAYISLPAEDLTRLECSPRASPHDIVQFILLEYLKERRLQEALLFVRLRDGSTETRDPRSDLLPRQIDEQPGAKVFS